MTPEQIEKFKLYGCGISCLMKLTSIHKKPINLPDFVDKFAPKYPIWSTQCGVTCTSMLIDIARELNICTHAETTADYLLMKNFVTEKCTTGVLIITARSVNKFDNLIENHHCTLLLDLKANLMLRWSQYQDGTCGVCPPINQKDLQRLLPHFLILQ